MRLLKAGDFQNLLRLVILNVTPSFIIKGFWVVSWQSLNLFLTLACLGETVISFERKVPFSSFSKTKWNSAWMSNYRLMSLFGKIFTTMILWLRMWFSLTQVRVQFLSAWILQIKMSRIYLHVFCSLLVWYMSTIKSPLLCAFTKVRKATIIIVMSLRPSVNPHSTTRLPLDGLSRNLFCENFPKLFGSGQVSWKPDENNWYFTWRPRCIYNISFSYS